VFYSQRKINYGLKEELLELFELSISLSKQMGAMMKYLRQKIFGKKLAAKPINPDFHP